MEFEIPFSVIELVLEGAAQGAQMTAIFLWTLPPWTKVLLIVAVVMRCKWPWLFADTATIPPRGRRRRTARRN